MKRRRVKITGIGFVTPAGIGKEAFKRGILKSVSHVGPITRFPEEAGPFVASEVKGFRLNDFLSTVGGKKHPRHTQFALTATVLALQDAGLEKRAIETLSPTIVTGTSLMDSEVINKSIENVAKKGPRFGLSRVVFQAPVSSIGAAIAELVGGGRTLALQSACCSGSDAIGHAAAMVANGESDIAICGGTEAPIFYHPMLELKMSGLSPDTSERPEQLGRPFDMWRTTGVVGEGACFMVLEPESSKRPGYAFVSGYSFATDRGNQPGEGLLEAITLCLANARIRTSEVEMISAWGPGHRIIDAVEAKVLRDLFRDELDKIPVVSIKGSVGNPFAAAGAIQAGLAALSIHDSFIPPTVNWTHPDPSCLLNLSTTPRFISMNNAIINSHGLSGTNSCLLVQR
ncbi:MAG TPA: beta-ketoacyl synthase N-terminal-like domain-containing protein [Opitutus sp.]|nr:beta-ketoacyl synthase N-terminal-like domain-containing protein [Opitutus sp.]